MNSSTTTLKSSLLLASMLMLLAFSSSDNSNETDKCTESVAGLATCLTYVGGTAKSPTPDCCNGLKQLLKTNKKCLCVIIKDANDPNKLGLNINVTLALTLPDVCNAPANISECPALLNLPPNSAEAQIFYQLGKKNGSSIASSPEAGGPTASVVSNPSSAPAGAAASPQKSGGCGRGKSKGWLGVDILLAGLVLLLALMV